MHWKDNSRNFNEEGGADESLTCPVCSTQLKRDVTLQDHLNSHPKQDVIEALIQLKDSIKESSNLRRSSIITPVPVASIVSTSDTDSSTTIAVSIDEESDQQDVEVAPSLAPSAHHVQIASTLPPGSGNHFISFPPFLSPSGIPQFISLPLVAGSSSSANQASVLPLLYNPYIYPSATPPISAEQIDMMRPFQILPTSNAQVSLQQPPPYPCTDDEGESDRPTHDKITALACKTTLESEDTAGPSCSTTLHESSVDLKDVIPHVTSNTSDRKSQDWSHVSPANQALYNAEGSLRVRTDLRVSAVSYLPESAKDLGELSVPAVKEQQVCQETVNSVVSTSINDELRSSCSEFMKRPVIVHLASKICTSRTDDRAPRPNAESSSNNSENLKPIIQTEPVFQNALPSTPSTATISMGVEGLHFLVTSHFLENSVSTGAKCDQSTEPLSPGRPISPPCDSSPTSPYQKSVDSPTVPLNIQTDETMPPRGELSEQESIGGNSSSMWSVPPYQMTRELLSPVVSTSFDLTARESWAGSDISDCEGNANQAPDTSVYKFTTTPSFSNTIPALLSKTSEGNSQDQKVPLPRTQLQGKGKGKGNKPPPKPRVYKCKACSLEFACPKERRVHPCEKKKEPKLKAVSAEQPQSVLHSVTDFNAVAAGSSTTNLKECTISPKRKYYHNLKAADVKREDVGARPTAPPHMSDVGPVGQSQDSGVWHPGQVDDIKRLQFPNNQPVDIRQVVEESVLMSSYQSVCAVKTGDIAPNSELAAEACAQTEDLTYVEVTPALLDERQRLALKNEFFKVKRCTECNQIFSSDKDLSRHLTSKHKINKYQCTTCGESFEKESTYYEHLNVHPLECKLCGKCFHRRKSLNLHMKWHMDVKPYKCVSCDKSFVTRQKLDEHQNTHTGNAPIKCPFCDETFKRYSNLIQHKNRHHLNIKRKVKDYICQCGEVFQSKKKLEWHKEIHDSKPKSCPFCNEKFVHTSSLTRHVRKAHDRRYVPKAEREGENVECPVCHCVFLKSSLATHLRVHSGERPFSCHICGRDFTTKWNLQHHKWTHASRSSKPFKCTLCKAAFYRKQDYSGHMRSHRNVRPFTCNHCGCQFIRKYNCLRHMKEHESDKKYTCTICNKTFHRGYYLKDHMRVHDGSRPFSCHICGKASTTKSNHNKHVRIHHAREPQNTEI